MSISRLQLLSALRKAREAMQAAEDPLSKLRHIKEVRALRTQLGADNSQAIDPAPPGEGELPDQGIPFPGAASAAHGAVNEHHQMLITIASGGHDGLGLTELYARIQEAVNALNDDLLLDGPALDAANNAITHWGELDQQENG